MRAFVVVWLSLGALTALLDGYDTWKNYTGRRGKVFGAYYRTVTDSLGGLKRVMSISIALDFIVPPFMLVGRAIAKIQKRRLRQKYINKGLTMAGADKTGRDA